MFRVSKKLTSCVTNPEDPPEISGGHTLTTNSEPTDARKRFRREMQILQTLFLSDPIWNPSRICTPILPTRRCRSKKRTVAVPIYSVISASASSRSGPIDISVSCLTAESRSKSSSGRDLVCFRGTASGKIADASIPCSSRNLKISSTLSGVPANGIGVRNPAGGAMAAAAETGTCGVAFLPDLFLCLRVFDCLMASMGLLMDFDYLQFYARPFKN